MSLALNPGPRKIRVNAVMPAPLWTPNIPGTMPAYVFLALEDFATDERAGQALLER